MKITKEKLADWNACSGGVEFFNKHFHSGEANYQDVLDALANENEAGYASWLMKKAGSEDTVIEVDEINTDKSFFFAGTIKVKGLISVTGYLMAGDGIKAGWSIEAGDGIKAGWSIEAGGGIRAGWSIEAGNGYGIFAGLRIRISDWKIYSSVIANTKPANLISGFWACKDEDQKK